MGKNKKSNICFVIARDGVLGVIDRWVDNLILADVWLSVNRKMEILRDEPDRKMAYLLKRVAIIFLFFGVMVTGVMYFCVRSSC